MRSPAFQLGGAVRRGRVYIAREADDQIVEALGQGELCHVLAPRQMGKSSLKVRAIDALTAGGVRCVDIDLSGMGTQDVTPAQWYYGIADELASQLDLEDVLDAFWEDHAALAPVHRWSRFLSDVLLADTDDLIVVFIDEIDSVLGLSFPTDDFFAAIRATYNRRARDAAFERLTFCLLGAASALDLVRDATRTPFNVGRTIELRDFTERQARDLLPHIDALGHQKEEFLAAAMSWTSGHAYMLMLVLDDVCRSPDPAASAVEAVHATIQRLFLGPEARRAAVSLQTAQDRLLRAGADTPRLLALYQRVRSGVDTPTDLRDPIQVGLCLTGAVSSQVHGEVPMLRVRNRVFAITFDPPWIEEQLGRRPYVDALARWVESRRSNDFLLVGEALEGYRAWAHGREDVTQEEAAYLTEGLQLAREQAEAARVRQVRRLKVGAGMALLLLAVGVFAVFLRVERRRAAQLAEQTEMAERQTKIAEAALLEADRVRSRALEELARSQEEQARREEAETALYAMLGSYRELELKKTEWGREIARLQGEIEVARGALITFRPGSVEALEAARQLERLEAELDQARSEAEGLQELIEERVGSLMDSSSAHAEATRLLDAVHEAEERARSLRRELHQARSIGDVISSEVEHLRNAAPAWPRDPAADAALADREAALARERERTGPIEAAVRARVDEADGHIEQACRAYQAYVRRVGRPDDSLCPGPDGRARLRTAKVPKIIPGKPIITGSLDAETIRRVIRRRRNEYRSCFDEGRAKDRGLQGKVIIRFTIAGNGSVIAASVAESTLGSAPVEECLTSKIRRWVFPAPRGGGIVIVNYPFAFEPGGPVPGPELTAIRSAPGAPMEFRPVEGALDKATIMGVVREGSARYEACRLKGSDRATALGGKVKVTVTVGPAGVVESAELAESTLQDVAVEGCLLAEAKQWVFPPPKAGGTVIFHYPFFFGGQ